MLMNNLDPDVAERPQDLVVYGGTPGGAVVEAFDAIADAPGLDDETMLVRPASWSACSGRTRWRRGS